MQICQFLKVDFRHSADSSVHFPTIQLRVRWLATLYIHIPVPKTFLKLPETLGSAE